MQKILVIDDDSDFQKILQEFLTPRGYEVLSAFNGEEGIFLCQSMDPDIVLLDIMMPGMEGFEVCKKIREFSTVPLVFLTAKTSLKDKEWAFEHRGDDYIVKPCLLLELDFKIKAILRRREVYQKQTTEPDLYIHIRGLKINCRRREVFFSDQKLPLRNKEYEILKLLATHRYHIFSQKELYETIWKRDYLSGDHNTIAAHIRNIRDCFRRAGLKEEIITTLWGEGYRID